MDTLGGLAFGSGHIYAQCMRCTHFALFRVVDLVIRYGGNTPVDAAARRLRCSVCGAQTARFTRSRPISNPLTIERHKIK